MHYRTQNVGLQAQWLESWWPNDDNEFAFVVEDDLEVSPLYYRFLKGLILEYYYNGSNYSPWIYGASLQRPRFVPGTILVIFVVYCLYYVYLYCFGDLCYVLIGMYVMLFYCFLGISKFESF